MANFLQNKGWGMYWNFCYILASKAVWSFKIGNKGLCINEAWPTESVKKKNKSKIAIQINGKTRDIISIDKNLKEEQIGMIAKKSKAKKFLENKKIIKTIFVKGKIINYVINDQK